MPVREVSGPGPARVGVVASRFNLPVTEPMTKAAIAVLEEAGVTDIPLAWVEGALELAVVAQAMIGAGCDGVVCVGAVIKGETDHYEYVSAETSRSIAAVALSTGRPIGNAVLTVREYEHAIDRSQPGASNKGAEAAVAVVAACRALAGLSS